LKDFARKAGYERHMTRKTPCKPMNVVKQVLEAKPRDIGLPVYVAPFRDLTITLNKELPQTLRKDQGIYFTPKAARSLVFLKFAEFGFKPTSILEPSCGSGEFLLDCRTEFPTASLHGVEFNETIVKKTRTAHPDLSIDHADFLKWSNQAKVDCIVGNPPYFVIKDKNPACMTGRPNIYVAFLYKCLTQHLKPDGFLAFVLPTSLFNCSYYEPMRRYIAKHCTIRHVQELDVKHYQTGQDTMLLILQNRPDSAKAFLFERNGFLYISPHAGDLKGLSEGSKTLKDLGFTVKTGDVVWNQEKEKLTNKPKGSTVLLYSSNIQDGKVVLHSKMEGGKQQYIKGFKKAATKGPALLVNRGYGNNYTFQCARTDLPSFYAENHVNMILPTTEAAKGQMSAVFDALNSEKTSEFLKKFVGNGALSKTELEQIVPVFV
jgi:adenine-specific DNA-methyltransferase